jgi:hypothetical protein
VGSTHAGGSAAAKAQELRDKAAKLEAQARNWDKGAEGERRTAAVLSGLAAHGYVVLDDLSIPGSKANIDHVVVGPTGVTVIETKAYSGNLRLSNGILWHGRYPLKDEIAAAKFETDKVRSTVDQLGMAVPVRVLMCIHGVDAVPSDPDGALAPIELCGPLTLLERIEASPVALTPQQVSHVVTALEQTLPPRRIELPAPPRNVMPSLGPAPSPSAGAPKLTMLPGSRSRSRTRSRGRSGMRRVDAGFTRAADAVVRTATRLLIGLIGLLLLWALGVGLLQGMAASVTKRANATTTTTTTVPVPLVDPATGLPIDPAAAPLGRALRL